MPEILKEIYSYIPGSPRLGARVVEYCTDGVDEWLEETVVSNGRSISYDLVSNIEEFPSPQEMVHQFVSVLHDILNNL